MPRDPKPWYRKDQDAWFVTINGRRYNLGPDRDATHDRFHELMLTGGEEEGGNGIVTVFELFDEFLEWTKAQRAPKTYDWYREFLERFSAFLISDRMALRLKPVFIPLLASDQGINLPAMPLPSTRRSYCSACTPFMSRSAVVVLLVMTESHFSYQRPT